MVNMINVSSIAWSILKEKEIYYDTLKTKLVKIKSLVSYMQAGRVNRDKKDILVDILTLCGLTVTKITTPNATSILFQTESSGKYGFLQVVLNSGVKIECTTTPGVGMIYFKPFESSPSSETRAISINNNSAIITGGNGVIYSFGYVAVCMDKYSTYRNMQSGIDPLKWAQNCVLQEISDPTNNTISLTNDSSFLAWTSLGKYYITNKQLQYFSVPTVAGEVQWGNELDSKGGWFVFDEKQDFGLAEQSEPKNFALVNSTDIPDQIIFENFSNNNSPTITWVDNKTIKINDSSFYIGEKGKVMVIKRGPAQTHSVSRGLKYCYFSSSWGTFKKNRTMFSHIVTEWNSNNTSSPPSRPDNKKVHVSLSSFPLEQGQLAQNQTSLSDIEYSTISSHKLLTTTSQTQEINNDLSLPLETSALGQSGYVPSDPTFYVFVGQTATAMGHGGMAGTGTSKSYASAYLRLEIEVTNLPVLKNQTTWLIASIGELYSDEHYVNDQVSYSGDYEHYLYYLWDLKLNSGLLNKDIDIYGAKADTIKYRTWLNTAYMYFPKDSSTQYVFRETKGLDDYTSSVYCGLGFLNNSDDYAYCIYITYTE